MEKALLLLVLTTMFISLGFAGFAMFYMAKMAISKSTIQQIPFQLIFNGTLVGSFIIAMVLTSMA